MARVGDEVWRYKVLRDPGEYVYRRLPREKHAHHTHLQDGRHQKTAGHVNGAWGGKHQDRRLARFGVFSDETKTLTGTQTDVEGLLVVVGALKANDQRVSKQKYNDQDSHLSSIRSGKLFTTSAGNDDIKSWD